MDRRMLWVVALFLLMLCPFLSMAAPEAGMPPQYAAEEAEGAGQDEAAPCLWVLAWMPLAPRHDTEAPPRLCQTGAIRQETVATVRCLGAAFGMRCADANGNPILAGTYIASVPHAFALEDLPI